MPDDLDDRVAQLEARLAVLASPSELANQFRALDERITALAEEVRADTARGQSQIETCQQTLDELGVRDRILNDLVNPGGRDYGEVLREIHERREEQINGLQTAHETYEPMFLTLVEAYAEMLALQHIIAAAFQAGTQRLDELLSMLRSGLPSPADQEPRPDPGTPPR